MAVALLVAPLAGAQTRAPSWYWTTQRASNYVLVVNPGLGYSGETTIVLARCRGLSTPRLSNGHKVFSAFSCRVAARWATSMGNVAVNTTVAFAVSHQHPNSAICFGKTLGDAVALCG